LLVSVIAAAGAHAAPTAVTAAHPSPTPTSSAATLTKFQREKLEKMKHSAPADEYFGKMKLSFLGINNTFRDQAVRAGDHTIDGSVISRVELANDSLRDWRRKYPLDPQLARSLFLGAKVYLKIWTTAAQTQAAALLIELRNKFPTTFFGKQAKSSLKKGFTMHVYAEAQPCIVTPDMATPTPAPIPTPNSKYNIKVSVEQPPCFVPSPSPSPSPTGSAALPSVTPSGGVPSPSANPTPQGSPSPTASPTASSSPSPLPSAAPSPTPLPSASASASPLPTMSPSASPRSR
jgi:hypothetical protein